MTSYLHYLHRNLQHYYINWLPVNSTHGQLDTRSTRHTVNSPQVNNCTNTNTTGNNNSIYYMLTYCSNDNQ